MTHPCGCTDTYTFMGRIKSWSNARETPRSSTSTATESSTCNFSRSAPLLAGPRACRLVHEGFMDPHEQSDRDFSRARRNALLRRIGAYLRRDPGSNQLLSFDEVKGALGAVSQVYLGLREVPVSKIVGSVGRHRDFDRAFLPSKPDLGTRWRRIDEIMNRAEELPPVSLYKIGDAYFVQDGNHRVSVARQQGVEMIDAEIIELRSRVPVDSALTARDLLHKLEHRHLLERLPI